MFNGKVQINICLESSHVNGYTGITTELFFLIQRNCITDITLNLHEFM